MSFSSLMQRISWQVIKLSLTGTSLNWGGRKLTVSALLNLVLENGCLLGVKHIDIFIEYLLHAFCYGEFQEHALTNHLTSFMVSGYDLEYSSSSASAPNISPLQSPLGPSSVVGSPLTSYTSSSSGSPHYK